MFQKIKQGRQMLKARSEMQKVQKELAEVTETVEKGNVVAKVSADQKVVYVTKDGVSQEDIVKAINEAFEKVQKKAFSKMLESEGISGILSKFGQ